MCETSEQGLSGGEAGGMRVTRSFACGGEGLEPKSPKVCVPKISANQHFLS